ncbi:pitrilysin family protein [Kangiella sp. TOML190]|uniref:M16 family metallopeptidase n=1 Tax=Kangiella sp. TOML190 TaxID=2931351 RepID=UPI00203D664B|nr:pitrilysin family protein [Kangiella sp. TOML190]
MKLIKSNLIAAAVTVGIAGLVACSSTPTVDLEQATAGITLVEEVKKSAGELVIPYKKYQLANGLTVILHEDNSDPLVHVDVTYHVGSGREDIGKSGFAHFFEHMMFQGSENVADEEHFKIITEAGGTLNGTTNSDRTNYFETVPSNQLEKMLWLEADRMGFLLDAVTQEKFEVQRETVKNERGQRVDNRPYGRLSERVSQALYPEGHPYSWPTIGWMEDLNRADVNDLKKFFLRWYGPNNATLTIGGRFDEEQTLAWVKKYFGSIPAGPEVADPTPQPVVLDQDRYISMEDNVSLPLIYMSFPTTYGRSQDEAALDVLSSILGQGKTSLFYKNLDKQGLTVQSGVSHPCSELACQFTLYALPNPAKGKSLADLEKIMRDTFKEFEQRGVQDDDLERVKAGMKSSLIYGLQSVSGKVSQLAANQTFEGNPNRIGIDLARYQNVTKQDVMRVYNRYIKNKSAVIMSIVPNGKPQLVAQQDTYQVKKRTIPQTSDDSTLELRIAKDNFDRSVKPASGENPSITLPEIWRSKLANGIEVLGANNNETPTTAISFRIENGHRNDPLAKAGLASMTASMMNEASESYSSEDLSNMLQKLGSSISFAAGENYTTMTISSLTENLDRTLWIASEKLFSPRFDDKDFKRIKDQTVEGIKFSQKQPSTVAWNVYNKLIYGDNSIGLPSGGTLASVANISLDDVKNFYKTQYSPQASNIVVVSDLSEQAIVDKLKRFSNWQGAEVTKAPLNPMPKLKKAIYLVDKPGAAQSEIRIGKRALPYDADGEYYLASLMNYNLGGAFNSRININLREDKGYTYGARSSFRGSSDHGTYTASAGVRSDVTDKSLIEFFKEIDNYQAAGMTEQELEFMKNSLGQSDARKYETPSQKLGLLSRILTYDLDDDYIEEQNDILEDIELEDLNELASKHLVRDEMIVVVVGDKKSILPGLQQLGYDIVELTITGELMR